MTLLAVLATVFVPQAKEKWYDLRGSLGFLSTTFVSLYFPTLQARYWHAASVSFPPLSSSAPRQLLLTAALIVWTIRLGSFLMQVITTFPFCSVCDYPFPVQRTIKAGGDSRFDSSITLGHFWRFGLPRVVY